MTGESDNSREVMQEKAQKWLHDARNELQSEADTKAYLSGIAVAGSLKGTGQRGEIKEEHERFLSLLEKNSWNEHIAGRLAELQDMRELNLRNSGDLQLDILGVQFGTLQIFLDTPDLYNPQ